ncbi:hypothetical protein STSP2_03018 [Anaerohalosphaera lusitana]|uniref:Integral membrane protein n=1 Tax=Anaerohalosphaera lusitana TaxID=1936003 RepID=A0A1U9NPH6_9BACT|nr:hypothetical protein [Anaerohalosphaera lusitana]AQT69821.1 hypothetical protein STSP2_03018 [Anaerohalosphaera lusitana]
MSKGLKNSHKNCGVLVLKLFATAASLTLPLVPLTYIAYSNTLSASGGAVVFFCLSLVAAASAFCYRPTYKVIILFAALVLASMLSSLMGPILLFFMCIFAGAFGVNLLPTKWNRFSIWIIPYVIARAVLAGIVFFLVASKIQLNECVLLTSKFDSLCSFTAIFILALLIFDLCGLGLRYCFRGYSLSRQTNSSDEHA